MTPPARPALDAFRDEFHQCPFGELAELRSVAPVHPLTETGWYIVTSMDLAREVLRDHERFSNRISRRVAPPPEVAEEVAAIRAQGHPYLPTLLTNDPPDHKKYRQVVQRSLTPRSLQWMEPLIAGVAEELASRLTDQEDLDFVADFALALPAWAICRVLGLPEGRQADVRRWADAATATIGTRPEPSEWPQIERQMLEFQQVIASEFQKRKNAPGEDLLTLMTSAGSILEGESDSEGGTFTVDEAVNLCRELLVAGTESTSRVLADIVYRLDADSRAWARVREEPAYADRIVEEAVRMLSPSASVLRRVTTPTTIGGVQLPAESILVVSLLSANRDETVFDEPDRFDPDRATVSRHLAFGQGIHACIGNSLARLEARLAVRALADQVERIDVVAPDGLRYIPSLIVRGLTALPVRVTRLDN